MRVGSAHGGVEVDEEGTRDIFAAASLGEEGLEGAALNCVGVVRVGAPVCFEAMLEEVAVRSLAFGGSILEYITHSSQALLPSWVPACPMWMWQTCRARARQYGMRFRRCLCEAASRWNAPLPSCWRFCTDEDRKCIV